MNLMADIMSTELNPRNNFYSLTGIKAFFIQMADAIDRIMIANCDICKTGFFCCRDNFLW